MALEYAPNKIRINAIAPAVIVTETVQGMLETVPDMAKAMLRSANPLLGPGNLLFC